MKVDEITSQIEISKAFLNLTIVEDVEGQLDQISGALVTIKT